ncbi:MAG: Fis family transcriptional regulator, partial [Deltaproteobacteria bacterium]
LVWSFIEEFSRNMGATIESVSQNSMERLQRHSWPGNVRELRNIVERSMIVNTGPALRLVAPTNDEMPIDVAVTLDEVQRRHIQQVVEMAEGRISGPGGAAKILGLKPTTLRSRMERLGCSPEKN